MVTLPVLVGWHLLWSDVSLPEPQVPGYGTVQKVCIKLHHLLLDEDAVSLCSRSSCEPLKDAFWPSDSGYRLAENT